MTEYLKHVVCMRCGSNNVVADSTSRWNPVELEWEVCGVLDGRTCNDCGYDGRHFALVKYDESIIEAGDQPTTCHVCGARTEILADPAVNDTLSYQLHRCPNCSLHFRVNPLPDEDPLEMTDEQYVANNGQLCPYCRSNDLRGGSFDCEGGAVSQQIDCGNCDKSWFDVYELKSFEPI